MRVDGRDRQARRGRQAIRQPAHAAGVISHPRWWSGLWLAVNRLSLPRKHYGPAVLIFQWTGRRKSEPSDLLSPPEHAPIGTGPATTLLLFEVGRQIHLQAKSTVEGANREKFARLAFEPDETRSPVDLGCEIPAKCASFVQAKRESRKLKTRWRKG